MLPRNQDIDAAVCDSRDTLNMSYLLEPLGFGAMSTNRFQKFNASLVCFYVFSFAELVVLVLVIIVAVAFVLVCGGS